MLFGPVFNALNASGVRYLVVGGVAVVLHGHPRLTADLDLVIDLAEESARTAIEALTGLGLRSRLPVDPLDFADPEIRSQWVRERGLVAFTLHDPDNPLLSVDLMAEPPDDFEALWARSVAVDLGPVRIRVIARDDLIAMKSRTGRPKDEADAEALRQLGDPEDGP